MDIIFFVLYSTCVFNVYYLISLVITKCEQSKEQTLTDQCTEVVIAR